jgi:hypothetical protein
VEDLVQIPYQRRRPQIPGRQNGANRSRLLIGLLSEGLQLSDGPPLSLSIEAPARHPAITGSRSQVPRAYLERLRRSGPRALPPWNNRMRTHARQYWCGQVHAHGCTCPGITFAVWSSRPSALGKPRAHKTARPFVDVRLIVRARPDRRGRLTEKLAAILRTTADIASIERTRGIFSNPTDIATADKAIGWANLAGCVWMH